MAVLKQSEQLFKGFSKLNRQERLQRLVKMGALTEQEVNFLNNSQGLDTHLAENFIENVIGYFQLPMGVATNFKIDGQDRVIPMAVEETSIIAAASKTARWVRENGEITTEVIGNFSIGQIQIAHVKDFKKLQTILTAHKQRLIAEVNEHVAASMVKRGGGVADLTIRHVLRRDQGEMAVIHVFVDTCDAMGANIINQICEYLKGPIEELTDEQVTMCILSNLVDSKLSKATAVIRNVDPELGRAIEEATHFADQDPYRAATNNKGALNGIDPIAIATGNDWRAIEAGIHTYAARSGQYRSITHWEMQGNDLIGTLEAPIIVGTVGGVTKLHPTAQTALNILGVQHADELSRIMAAVGLIQNLGALKALTTVGIIQGHMKLHISNLTLEAGAQEQEIPFLRKRLERKLMETKRVTLTNAIEILNEIRKKAALTELAEAKVGK